MRTNKIDTNLAKLYAARGQKLNYTTPNLQELYDEYLKYILTNSEISKEEASRFRSTLFRFVLPAFEPCLVDQNKKRMTNQEIINCYDFLSKVPKISIPNLMNTYNLYVSCVERKITKSYERTCRSVLNHFMEWLDQEKYIEIPKKIKINNNLFDSVKVAEGSFSALRATTRKHTVYSILEIYKELGLDLTKYLKQIADYDSWGTINIPREVTKETHIGYINRYVGWLYKHNFEQDRIVDLEKVVPAILIEKDADEFETYEKFLLYKDTLKRKAIKQSKILEERLEQMFNERNASCSGRMRSLEALTSYYKYIYRYETDSSLSKNYEDIVLISMLRRVKRKYNAKNKVEPRIINIEKRMITWSKVKYVYELLRQEACTRSSKGHTFVPKRKAYHHLKFLLLSLFMAIPPLRQRAIRELRFDPTLTYKDEDINTNHRTLKYGLFIKGEFIPSIKLNNLDDAKWIIDLRPKDYKTGNTYGRWIKEIPNVSFSDNSKLYDYFNIWLFNGYKKDNGTSCGYRDLLNPIKHNLYPNESDYDWFFIGKKTGKRLHASNLGDLIKRCFYNKTGADVTPHTLRHIFRTEVSKYGLTQQQDEAISFLLQHSKEMGKDVYLHRTNDELIQPGIELMTQLNMNVF